MINLISVRNLETTSLFRTGNETFNSTTVAPEFNTILVTYDIF